MNFVVCSDRLIDIKINSICYDLRESNQRMVSSELVLAGTYKFVEVLPFWSYANLVLIGGVDSAFLLRPSKSSVLRPIATTHRFPLMYTTNSPSANSLV